MINYTDKEISYTRMIEHKHFENCKSKRIILTKEYPLRWEKGREAYLSGK